MRQAEGNDQSLSPGWMLDEHHHAGRENLDVDHVTRYDDKQDANATAEVEVLSRLGLDGDATVVDLGAGTGQFALAIAPVCARVIAVDVSPVMLAVLRDKVERLALSNIEVVEAGFLSYEHRGPLADIVYSRWALHHLPDFWKALALTRIRNILRPNGVLRLSDIVYAFDPSDAPDRMQRWCATLPVDTPGDGWVRADIEDHIRDEHSTFTWLLEPMLERAGFAIEDAVYSDDGFYADYVARAV